MDTKRLSFDSDKLRYEIFSMLESNFLFGYQEQKLWLPQLVAESPRSYDGQKKRGGKVCILSIDGGGMRGVVAGRTLAYLEDALRRKSGDPDARIADYFDVATGTSVGGILTAMLFADGGRGRPLFAAEDTWRAVAESGKKMFRGGLFRGGLFRRVTRGGARFSSKGIEGVLRGMLGHMTLKDTLKAVLIPCYDLCSAAPLVFSRADALETDAFDFRLWEVCRATAAAPGLFPPAVMASVDGRTACTAVDGGLVMNNPTAAAVTHVLHNKREFPAVAGVEDMLVLSLGTGQFVPTYDLRTVKRWGPSDWAKPAMNIVSDGLSDAVDHAISLAFGRHRGNYVRLQGAGGGRAGATDDPSDGNVAALLKLADDMLAQKSMESLPFGGKRVLPQTNAERLDWFAEQLVLERESRRSRPSPTVVLKRQSPRNSLAE